MVMEFVTYWGPSLNDWGDVQERHVVERDESLLKGGRISGGRSMKKISINDIFEDGVVTGVDMENGYMPLVLYANDDLIIEVANCDREQGAWHRNMGGDEWVFQYRGSRKIETEVGDITIAEGEMSVIPRGISHKNVGLGPNIEITIYTKKPLKRMAPEGAAAARERMSIEGGKPVSPPVTLDDGVLD